MNNVRAFAGILAFLAFSCDSDDVRGTRQIQVSGEVRYARDQSAARDIEVSATVYGRNDYLANDRGLSDETGAFDVVVTLDEDSLLNANVELDSLWVRIHTATDFIRPEFFSLNNQTEEAEIFLSTLEEITNQDLQIFIETLGQIQFHLTDTTSGIERSVLMTLSVSAEDEENEEFPFVALQGANQGEHFFGINLPASTDHTISVRFYAGREFFANGNVLLYDTTFQNINVGFREVKKLPELYY